MICSQNGCSGVNGGWLHEVNADKETGEWPPRFAKFCLVFRNKMHLSFTNSRRLGRVLIRSDPQNEPPLTALGVQQLQCVCVCECMCSCKSTSRMRRVIEASVSFV